MEVTLNDRTFIFPSSLAEYTLGQRIDFQLQHGNQLDEMLKSIIAMEDGFEKELEITQFQFEKCFRTFAFFAGVDHEVLKASEYVDTISNIYFANTQILLEQEEQFELSLSYEWKGDIWEIHPPSLKQGSRMTFGEFVDSKQAIKDMIALGKGQWENLLPLAAIYFRKKDEAYDESFLYEDSDRLKLMRELPLDMAMSVGFFLTSSLNFALNTFQSSFPQKANPEDFQRSISSYGVGSTSSKRSLKQKSSISPTVGKTQLNAQGWLQRLMFFFTQARKKNITKRPMRIWKHFIKSNHGSNT